MRTRLMVLILLTAGVTGLFAQETDWYIDKPIQEIRLDGLDRVSKSEIDGLTRPFVGRPFSEALLLDLQRRLYALEYFEYLIPEALPADDARTAVILIFTLKERPVIDNIEFDGNAGFRSDDLINEIVTKLGQPVSRSKLTADEQALKQFYLENGYSNVEVRSELINGAASNSQTVRFIIAEGYKTSIRQIQFSGNLFASATTLKGLLKSAEQSLFNNGLFQEANLALDTQALLKYYREAGFVDARIADVQKQTEISDQDQRVYLTITFYIEEGEQWTFGGYEILGNEIFAVEDLLRLTTLKPGAILNFSRLQADYQAVADQYYQNGYINNVISLIDIRNESVNQIAYQIRIIERGRAYIENIIIRGASKTLPQVILRELPFETGDIFSASRIRQGLQNLNNRRYFSSVVPETPTGSAEGLYDLILNVTEQNTTDVRIGFALNGATEFPISGILKWADTNFLGLGTEFGLDVSLSRDDQSISVSYTDPWLFGPRWSGGASISFARSLKSGIPQDLYGPVFSAGDPNAVPDPYVGYYVFTSSTEYGGETYKKGDIFPGVPTEAEIEEYNLVTDYVYEGGASGIPSQYTMSYTNLDFSVGLNSGIRARTPIGWFGFSTYGSVSLNYVDYDQTIYRPFDEELRENYQQVKLVNRLGFYVNLDNRDLAYDPASGFYVNQGIGFTGGFLFGERHYIRTDTTLQAYLTLWDVPVFEGWNWKAILALNSSLSVLWPQFWTEGGNDFAAAGNYLYTNSMTVARGWSPRLNGEALFNNWIELRMPIVPGVFSFDFFFDIVRLTEQRDNIFSAGSQGWLFGFGAGFRLTNPSLPLRLYLGKRFSLDEAGNVVWQAGNLGASSSDPTAGIDLIFAFSIF